MADLRAARQKKTKQPLGALAKVRSRETNSQSLAALKARRQKQPALARIRQRRRSPDDFTVSGVLYHNPKVIEYRGDSPLGTVDVTNGRTTFKFTNLAGSWMHPVPGMRGHYKEPAALGLGSQLEVCTNLNARFGSHLKAEGILTAAQKRIQREMQAKQARKAQRAPKRTLAARKAISQLKKGI